MEVLEGLQLLLGGGEGGGQAGDFRLEGGEGGGEGADLGGGGVEGGGEAGVFGLEGGEAGFETDKLRLFRVAVVFAETQLLLQGEVVTGESVTLTLYTID